MMILIGKGRITRRKACPSATFSTTNLTWTDLGANPGLHGGRPATNRLSHGTAGPYKIVKLKNKLYNISSRIKEGNSN
jgi:hypothetical protein